ncbi:MAG TPA: hypothetical protein VH277_01635 [Gemmatimonadaceae bacterium]|jgi:hypothetical protein|nr:hypothetical protein [Gemmatimonadaceae bacterium]
MMNIQTRVRLTAAGVLASALVAGCDVKQELLSPQQPGTLTPGDVAAAGPAGAEALRIGAIGSLQQMVGGGTVNQENVWMMSDLLTDVWKSTDTFLERNETDRRAVQSSNSVWGAAYLMAQRARGYARDAAGALSTSVPTQPGEQAQMWFIVAFAEQNLNQDFCNGVPFGTTVNGLAQYQPGITNQAGFQLAAAHYDTALALAAGTDSVASLAKTVALIGKAMTLVDLGQFAQAAALVPSSAVPTSFVYSMTFAQTSQSNEIWSLNASQSSARYAVGDSVDLTGTITNALPFASASDSRVPISGGSSTNAAKPGIDKATPWVGSPWTVRSQAIPVVTGVDARLIEAEAALQSGNYVAMTNILNTLRAAKPNLGWGTAAVLSPLVAPVTKDAAVRLFFREKGFWQFGRGQRLSDLRRMVRQYGYTQDQVFPTGKFHKGGSYDVDVNAPVPDIEKSNPLFTGCIDRNA